MRTYSSFLLFEDVLDYLDSTNTTIYNFCLNAIRPIAKVVTADCGTKIGRNVDVNFEIEGLIELATGLTISQARITSILSSGVYKVAVRDLHACVAIDGICQSCYKGTYIDSTIPAIGANIRLEPDYNYQTDVLIGNGGTTVFTLSESPSNYNKVLVIIGGIIQNSGYTISGTTITFTSPLAFNTNAVVRFHKLTTAPFVGYLAQTYAGALMGMKPLPTQVIHIRPSLLQASFTQTEFDTVKKELERVYHDIIDPSSIDYIDSIIDPLEKALYIALLHGLYANVSI
jgi:hypothetical protein